MYSRYIKNIEKYKYMYRVNFIFILGKSISVSICRHNIDYVINDEHNRIIIVVLAKHEIAPWWWFLREPKHVGAIVGILIPMIL